MRTVRLHREFGDRVSDKDLFRSSATITFLAFALLLLWAISPAHAASDRASIELDTIESQMSSSASRGRFQMWQRK